MTSETKTTTTCNGNHYITTTTTTMRALFLPTLTNSVQSPPLPIFAWPCFLHPTVILCSPIFCKQHSTIFVIKSFILFRFSTCAAEISEVLFQLSTSWSTTNHLLILALFHAALWTQVKILFAACFVHSSSQNTCQSPFILSLFNHFYFNPKIKKWKPHSYFLGLCIAGYDANQFHLRTNIIFSIWFASLSDNKTQVAQKVPTKNNLDMK